MLFGLFVRFASFLFLLILSISGICSVQAATGWDWIRLGDSTYSRRAEGAQGDHANRELSLQSIAAYRKALIDPKVERVAASRLLRALYFQGCFAYQDKNERLQVFSDARSLGERMYAKYPADPDLSYWYSVHLSLWAKESGVWAAIRSGVADRIRTVSESALKNKASGTPASNSALAGVYQILGRMNHLLPHIPWILSWPDKKKAEAYLVRATQLEPGNISNYLFLAEYYRDMGRYEDARRVVVPYLNVVPRPSQVLEDRRALWKMRELDLALRAVTEPERLAMAKRTESY